MKTKFINSIIYGLLFAVMCIVSVSIILTSCEKDDDGDGGKIVLSSYGPMPVARGAELRFIGINLDKVTSVMLPGDIEITTFGTKTSALLTITVPQNAIEGLVVLKTPQGDITTKTPLGFSEPISILSFSPTTVKADSVLTITGDYLNLVKEVIFTDRVAVGDTLFISQSRSQITLHVAAAAQSGLIAVSNGNDDPIIVYSTDSLMVKLPVISSINPNPVKAGTQLTVTGSDLDLVEEIVFGGNKKLGDTAFIASEGTIAVNVPDDAQDGTLVLIPASGIHVESASVLIMVVPTVSIATTTVKNGDNITVTGTNLDLVDQVIFGGDKEGEIISGGTGTQIEVAIPEDAVSGVVKFVTLAIKEVTGPALTMIDPVLTSFSPASAKAKTDITIDGTDLDVVKSVLFSGGVSGTIGGGSTANQLIVTIPVGAKKGVITLVAKNGTEVESTDTLTILSNLPTITSFTESNGTPDSILTINGTNMLLIKELVFPGNVTATAYGSKSDTKVEVYVPASVTFGIGNITMITYEGEEGLLPELFFGTTDPVADPSLMITDCENADIPGNWGGNIEVISDPADAYFGNYIHGTASALNGWAWLWGNNWYTFPSVDPATHLFKIDINITKPFGTTNVHFQMEFGGNRIDLGAFGMSTASETTNGWITVTYDLSTSGLPDPIPADGEWGINFWYADGDVDISGLYMDNMRFELAP